MGIGDSITLVSCLAGTMLALPALLVLLAVMYGKTSHLAALRLRKGVILPFFMGLPPIVGIGVPAALLVSLGSVFQLMGTIAFLLLFLWGFLGLACISRMVGILIGEQVRPFQNNVVLETASGAAVLGFAIAFPVIGWLLIFPLGVVIGIGGTVLSITYRLRGIDVADMQAEYKNLRRASRENSEPDYQVVERKSPSPQDFEASTMVGKQG